MLHGVMRQGTFEANARVLQPGGTTYVVDGAVRELPAWPASVDGIRFGALERRRRMLIVRVAFGDQDVILHQPVVLDPVRHLDGRRPEAAVVVVGDDLAERILDDVLAANPAQTNAIALVVNRVNQVRRASREAAASAAEPAQTRPGTANG